MYNKTSSKDLAIVMPAFNEADGIPVFIEEICKEFSDVDLTIYIVDDCSTDDTAQVIHQLIESGKPVEIIRNAVNRGHGPSTRHALTSGVDSAAPIVMSVDGDGQFYGYEMRDLYNQMLSNVELMVLEGVRTGRSDEPAYRKIVSAITRSLVKLKSGSRPKDANTPLRIYKTESLLALLAHVPEDCMIPNLFISAMVRKGPFNFQEQHVSSIVRRGKNTEGTTWKSKFKSLPSKRFRKFVVQATSQWMKFKAPEFSQ